MASTKDKPDAVATASDEMQQSAEAETKADGIKPTEDDKPPQGNRPSTGRSAKLPKEPVRTWIYIGPTIPRTALVENGVTKGTRTAVEEHFNAVLEKHPTAKNLIVAIEEMTDARAKVRAPGNILSKMYADLVAAIKS